MRSQRLLNSWARMGAVLTGAGCGLALSLLAFTLLPGCSAGDPLAAASPPTEPPWFVDVTDAVHLDFIHDAGPVGSFFMPQIMGSGAALFDFDGDGRLDIYLIQNAGPNSRSTNRLYRQEPDGRFTDVSKGSGLDVAGFGMGVAIGDVNNDGRPDVLLTEFRGIKLFLNNGDGTFTDVTRQAGLDDPLWATSACFLDYDRDGWLDLVVTNYVSYHPSAGCESVQKTRDYCHPRQFSGTVTKLYRNLGRPPGAGHGCVQFQDVTLASGLGRLPGPGLGVTAADFDGDGWPDILVANDAQPNRLWINQRNGTFVDEALRRGIAYNALGVVEGNMGVALGDVDGSGLCTAFITHVTEETNRLWVQGPRGKFRDRTAAAGLAHTQWRATGFGAVLADFDHDGALDLAVVNGRINRGKSGGAAPSDSFWSQYGERNQLFANDGTGKFRDLSADNGDLCGAPRVARGLACGDVNGDGALDLLVTNIAGRARLYRNVAPNRGHWLIVRAVDPRLNRDAYGAEVVVQAGGRRWVSWINPGQSYLCSNDPRAHFGLGAAVRIDAVQVRWPDGRVESFGGRAADQAIVLRRGEGKADAE